MGVHHRHNVSRKRIARVLFDHVRIPMPIGLLHAQGRTIIEEQVSFFQAKALIAECNSLLTQVPFSHVDVRTPFLGRLFLIAVRSPASAANTALVARRRTHTVTAALSWG